MSSYVEIRNAFQFLECAVRQKETLRRCRGLLPTEISSRRGDSALRDFIFCLFLVSVVAQLEADIEQLSGIPNLSSAGKLAPKLRILRDHFQVSSEAFDKVDRIRQARNEFIHQGSITLDAGCTKAEVPGIIATFLQRCKHPDYP